MPQSDLTWTFCCERVSRRARSAPNSYKYRLFEELSCFLVWVAVVRLRSGNTIPDVVVPAVTTSLRCVHSVRSRDEVAEVWSSVPVRKCTASCRTDSSGIEPTFSDVMGSSFSFPCPGPGGVPPTAAVSLKENGKPLETSPRAVNGCSWKPTLIELLARSSFVTPWKPGVAFIVERNGLPQAS